MVSLMEKDDTEERLEGGESACRYQKGKTFQATGRNRLGKGFKAEADPVCSERAKKSVRLEWRRQWEGLWDMRSERSRWCWSQQWGGGAGVQTLPVGHCKDLTFYF